MCLQIQQNYEKHPQLMPVCPVVAGEIATTTEKAAEGQYQQDLSAYEAEEDRVKFKQATLDT